MRGFKKDKGFRFPVLVVGTAEELYTPPQIHCICPRRNPLLVASSPNERFDLCVKLSSELIWGMGGWCVCLVGFWTD